MRYLEGERRTFSERMDDSEDLARAITVATTDFIRLPVVLAQVCEESSSGVPGCLAGDIC